MENAIIRALGAGLVLVLVGFILFGIGHETGWEGLASFGTAVVVLGVLIGGLALTALAVMLGVGVLFVALYVVLAVALLIVAAMGLWLVLVLLGLAG